MAAVGLGLFVSSISKTMQQAMLYVFLLVMPFALLSGFITPFSSMPEALQTLMVINPLRYALDHEAGLFGGCGLRQFASRFHPARRNRWCDPVRRVLAVQAAADLMAALFAFQCGALSRCVP